MSNKIVVAIAQLNSLVGDIEGNTSKVIEWSKRAVAEHGAQLIVFPELALIGYPPEDLLMRATMQPKIEQAIERIKNEVEDIYIVVGYPRGKHSAIGSDGDSNSNGAEPDDLYNGAGVIFNGELIAEYYKSCLPNYQVFDEKRYFIAGQGAVTFSLNGISIALTICEDIWNPAPMMEACQAGASLMLNLNASPYHVGKRDERLKVLSARAKEGDMPIVYCNTVGGQDELVFDGGSIIMGASGEPCFVGGEFNESLDVFAYDDSSRDFNQITKNKTPIAESDEASIYNALVLGVRDYVNKNGFSGAVLGLSGGIDSALTLAVAVDALGAERVQAVMMPFEYTSQMSLEDAEEEARILNVPYSVIPIASMYKEFMQALDSEFKNTDRDTTEENLQARCRGVLLMALSNKKRYIVLTTGNKSEMAVGYATLYGDMAGGFCVLKDVAKTMVFKLSTYRNSLQNENVIPQRVIDRPPSAELAPDQKDSDSLPDYPELDAIIEMYVELDVSQDDIIAKGYEAEAVRKVVRLIQLNEYKRRQSPVGPRVTSRNFGKDRRYPITSGWKSY